MLPSVRVIGWGIAATTVIFGSSRVMAKGLGELSEAHPSRENDATDDGDEAEDQGAPAKSAGAAHEVESKESASPVSAEKSVLSKALSGRLSIGTSYGWIFGSRSTGSWNARGGMSDVTVGYRVLKIGKNYDGIGTYRYAPISVTGRQGGQSYRGIWETHFAGFKVSRPLKGALIHGSFELGYVASHVQPTDDLPERTGIQVGGVSAVLGGGADFKVLESVLLGPQINLGFGSTRTVQVAGAANFLF